MSGFVGCRYAERQLRARSRGGAFCAGLLVLALTCLVPRTARGAEQFRAAWADVFHNGMRSAGDIDTMISKLVTGNYNAVIVQVLAYMDGSAAAANHGAYWKSSILPWSGYTTEAFDPLAYVCERAHANGIEVHAWLGGSGGGPYRVSLAWPPVGNAILAAHPEWMMVPQANSEGGAVMKIGNNYLLDMGSSDAQEYLITIIRELVTNYPIDGIHWDDEIDSTHYNAGMGFPAYSAVVYPRSGLARYRANTGYIGTPDATDAAYGDYRRRFKNELIARCQAEIQSIKTNPRQPLRHSAAVVSYGSPPGTCDFTASTPYIYYVDWAGMLRNGWLDAAIPMNYKRDSVPAQYQMFRDWVDRSVTCWRYDRDVFIGLGAYLNSAANTITQLEYVFNAGLNGAVTYSYSVPSSNAVEVATWWNYVRDSIYTNPTSVPAMPWRNPATASEGMMWGRVKDARTGLSIDDAIVTVTGGPTVRTDGNGYYVATLIPAAPGGTVHPTTARKGTLLSQTIPGARVLPGDVVRYDFFFNLPRLQVAPTATNTVLVSWPSPCPGWSLEQVNNVNSTNWTPTSETVTDNGVTKSILLDPASGTRYFRLRGS